MFRKYYLKVKDEHELKVRGMVIEKYWGIVGPTSKSNGQYHEYIMNIGPFTRKRFERDVNRALKMGLIEEAEEL
jgi:hypothetical protein